MRLGITGHRGLPDHAARLVRAALTTVIEQYPPTDLIGVSCIADGPDAWFAEAVLDHGGQIEVVIPAEEYRENLPESHHSTYDALLRRACEVHVTGLKESTSEAHQAGSEILVGVVDLLLAVWDGQPARGYGGTADVVAYAKRTGVPYSVIWPDGATRD
ncbi:hypothetical protein RVR_5495 [Actinacidiphila reveromycinica]|uniref:Uncharacterized protein n=1 Tax=Actinacidiphila reveromycinica TaxID=659352 RepID=A0A7U3UUL8_9ACTN|nr:hypothetical protein [Streptomyces sp. SN-593]BBA99040.1 hypothetical protein RVR_5495 [Streptomyces sp. SN-593]